MGKHSTPSERPDSEAIKDNLPTFVAADAPVPEGKEGVEPQDIALRVNFLPPGEGAQLLVGHLPFLVAQLGKDEAGLFHVNVLSGGGLTDGDPLELARYLHELAEMVAQGTQIVAEAHEREVVEDDAKWADLLSDPIQQKVAQEQLSSASAQAKLAETARVAEALRSGDLSAFAPKEKPQAAYGADSVIDWPTDAEIAAEAADGVVEATIEPDEEV